MNEHLSIFRDVNLDNVIIIHTTVGKFFPIKGSLEIVTTEDDIPYAVSFMDINRRELITKVDWYSIISISIGRDLVAGE